MTHELQALRCTVRSMWSETKQCALWVARVIPVLGVFGLPFILWTVFWFTRQDLFLANDPAAFISLAVAGVASFVWMVFIETFREKLKKARNKGECQ